MSSAQSTSGKCIAITNVDSWLGCCAAMHLAQELEKKCKQVQLVCLARHDENLDRLRKFKNVKIMTVNYDDQNSLEQAFRNVSCTILLPEMDEHRTKYAKNTLCAMKKEGVKGCMMLSVEGAGESNLRELESFREIEEQVQKHVNCFVILRKSILNQCLFLWSPIIQEKGELPMTVEEDRSMTPLDLCDLVCAMECIVVEHCQRDTVEDFGGKHKNRTYTLTGPQKITPKHLVHELNDATGNQVQYKHVSRDQLKSYLESLKKREGWVGGEHGHHHYAPNEAMINLLLDELELIKKGEAGFVSGDLRKITGNDGKTVKEFFRKEKDAFKPRR